MRLHISTRDFRPQQATCVIDFSSTLALSRKALYVAFYQ